MSSPGGNDAPAPAPRPAAGRLARLNRALHRDLGFLCAGLTVLYCVSGVAVNHVSDWNPNYRVVRRAAALPDAAGLTGEALLAKVTPALSSPGPFKNSFAVSPSRTRLFYEGALVDVETATGNLEIEEAVERPVLYALNHLHLNRAKGWWTHVADLFAVALAALAVSGLFLTRGTKGLAGRGGILFAAGILLPLLALLLLP